MAEDDGPAARSLNGGDATLTLTLATAAHELKNALAPLALRLGRLELAAKAGRVPAVEELAQARTEVRRLSGLINELMDDARLAETGVTLLAAPFDLGDVVTTLGRATATAWEGRRALVVTVPPGAHVLEGDAARVRAVLENFLDNADKFSPPGAPVELGLEVRGAPEGAEPRDSGGGLRAFVRDRGPGLDDADRPRLFTRFFRAAATAKETRGFGLGLYHCREIAHAHGGEVGVNSAPGAGATFWLDLPSPAS